MEETSINRSGVVAYPQASRLQLGASRLEHLSAQGAIFFDQSWIHLGDPASEAPNANALQTAYAFWKVFGLAHLARALRDRLRERRVAGGGGDPYDQTEFRPWRWQKGDRLPFGDAHFRFVYSEHFFEHLFLDEAADLLRECRRVLDVGGVIRTLVPDADLRVDAKPEAVGFPSRRLPWTHPQKHKTRWSVYALDEVLRANGFEPVWLRYGDRHGRQWAIHPADIGEAYAGCLDRTMIDRLDYVRRSESLIVDGIKRRA